MTVDPLAVDASPRRRRRALAALSLGLLALALPREAARPETFGAWTVADFAQACGGAHPSLPKEYCEAEIRALARQLSTLGSYAGVLAQSGEPARSATCPPDVAAAVEGAAVEAFEAWAARNPDRASTPYAAGIIAALQESWPCRQ